MYTKKKLNIKKIDYDQGVSNFMFWLYIYFIIDFFLHLSARIPGYGVLRPTLLLVVLITIGLFCQSSNFKIVTDDTIFKKLKYLIYYIIFTVPIVEFPGSVLNNSSGYIKAIVFFFFTALTVDSEYRLKVFIFIYTLSQSFRVLEPLYLNITEGYWGSNTHLGHGEFADRLAGAPLDVINPNGLGFVIVTIIPFFYYLALKSPVKKIKLLSLIVLPLLFYALVLTMSRGAFIALLIVLWMILKDSKNKMIFLLFIFFSGTVIWSKLSDHHKDRYMSLVSSDAKQSGTVDGRINGTLNDFTVVLNRPIVGHGIGTSGEAKTHAGVGWRISHNLYAEVLIEVGTIGFILFFLFLKAIYNKLKHNACIMKKNVNLNEKDFSLRLNKTLKTVFWMYVVYSINYFGLSTYYWYMFAGTVIAFSRVYFTNDKNSLHFT